MPLPSSITAGDVLDDRFRLLQHIHTDTAGAVYDALDEHTAEIVRLRTPVGAVDRRRVGILHDGLARPLLIAHDDRFIVLQDLGDEPLAPTSQGTPVERLQDALRNIFPVFEALHANGVVHGSIRLSSLWADEEGAVRIMDLGLPQHADATTDAFSPPEVAFGSPCEDPRGDVFALAALLYTWSTGRLPHRAGLQGGSLPEPILRVFTRALATSPVFRPANATELRRDLEEALSLMALPGDELADPSTMDTAPPAAMRAQAPRHAAPSATVPIALLAGGTTLIAGSAFLLLVVLAGAALIF
jgi:serine/threonine protein kinase